MEIAKLKIKLALPKLPWFVIFIWFCINTAHATDLLDVYQQALSNDPEFKSSYSNFLAKSEKLPQAWSILLPQLTLDALINRNSQFVDSGVLQVNQRYNGNEWRLSATQNIFNLQAWEQVQQAGAEVKAALATFNNETQDLIIRTTNAYLNVLFAKDTLNFAESKKRANKRQYEQASHRFEVGVEPITSVYEAQAAYDQSVSDVIAAKNNLLNTNQLLSKITNHIYEELSPIRNSKIPLIKPEPNNVDDWVATGLKQNYLLQSAKFEMQSARDNLKAKSAGHLPVFTLRGDVTDTHLDAGSENGTSPTNVVNDVFIPNERRLTVFSLNMRLPIFQGGLVVSQTRQAMHEFQSKSQFLEKIYRDVIVQSNIAFNNITDSISKITADRQTIISQENSLNSVSAQYEVGLRTMTDVVLAQRNLFEGQKQLANDQYNFIKAILDLKYKAGSLNVNDLQEINSWLETMRVSHESMPNSQTRFSLKSQALLKNLP
jgi:outer membrane protein